MSPVQAGTIRLQGVGGAFNVPVQSRKEGQWGTVIRQQYDFSCGAAAVATLLTYHYDLPTREDDVLQAMVKTGNQRQIQAVGFSMLDMKRYLDNRGFRSDGFRVKLDKLAAIGVPGITMIDINGYKHFVVVKGVDDKRVLIADPALGTRVLPRASFEKMWNGAVLAARESMRIAQQHFNEEEDWRVQPKAPVGEGVNRSGIGTFTLTLPSRHEFGR
ncbi:MAG: C39 family peptidase [Pyrinomonadaceae bacterium]